MLGQLLDGRYQVIRVLGSGGFGQTYIAQDTKLPGNPVCVVKQLKPTSSGPKLLETIRRLFQREAETLAKLSHYDQIPRLLAYNDEEFYLVQEFIEGQPLKNELLPGQCWSENQTIEMLQEVLGILEIVHSYGVIHRDIKPDNIIRRASDNKLVLIDFGAIKQVRTQVIAEQEQVSATIAIGTPGYMPTEQGLGKPRPNSDIYSLGIIGIQAVTGLYPYQFQEDLSTGEIIWQHQAQVNPGFAEVLTTMVRYHFKDRYQSATEALQALQELINPAYVPSAQAFVASMGLMHELTLEWMEAGQLKTQTLNNKQLSKNPGTIRIGRDRQACDIVLSEPTVSGLHAEIFYNSEQQCFYLRPLRQSNPPVIDGQPLLMGEVVLSEGSNLRLGQLDLRVREITLKHYPVGYTSIRQITPPQTIIPDQSILTTQQPLLLTTTPEQPAVTTQQPLLPTPLDTKLQSNLGDREDQEDKQDKGEKVLCTNATSDEHQSVATSLQAAMQTVIQQSAATSLQPTSLTTGEQQPAATTSLQPTSSTTSEQQPAATTSLQTPPTAIKEQPAATTQQPLPSDSAPNKTLRSPANRSSAKPVRRPAASPPIIRPVTISSNKLPRLVGVSVLAIAVGVGGLAFITNSRVQTKSNTSSIAIDNPTPPPSRSQKPQAQGGCVAVVEGHVRFEPIILPDNIIEFSLGQKLAVTGKQTQKGWVEVKRSNGDLAWVHQDVISNRQEMNSCLKTKGISVQTVEDTPNPQDFFSPQPIDLDNPANSFSLPSPTINLDKPTNNSSLPSPTIDLDKPTNTSDSSSPAINPQQPANTSDSSSPAINPQQPANTSNSSSPPINPQQPANTSDSSSPAINPQQPANTSDSSSPPINPQQPTDGSSSSKQSN
jgi:eukaryotic-like serine/threonine-protein kinase